jgi:hypothetical protein
VGVTEGRGALSGPDIPHRKGADRIPGDKGEPTTRMHKHPTPPRLDRVELGLELAQEHTVWNGPQPHVLGSRGALDQHPPVRREQPLTRTGQFLQLSWGVAGEQTRGALCRGNEGWAYDVTDPTLVV